MSGSPGGWILSDLKAVAEIEMGQSPPGEATNLLGRGLPLVGGAADFSGGEVVPSRHTEQPTKVSHIGDLILCVRATIGKVARGSDAYCLGRGVAGLRPVAIEPALLSYLLRKDAKALDEAGSGTTFRQVDKATLSGWPVPLAPLAEQRRIVAKLDALTARTARARADLDRVPALAEQQRRSALYQAFNGALTADWRSGRGEATIVAPRALTEIRSKYQDGASRPYSPPFQLPDGWAWRTLPQLGDLDRGKSRHRPRNDKRLFGGPYPFVQTGEVRAARRYLGNFGQTYSEFGLAQSRLWRAGTLCITIAANIAETAILTIDACFPDSVVGFVPDEGRTTAEYAEYFMRTARDELSQFAPATAQKNINLDTLGIVRVPIAPFEEQREIVRRLDAAFAEIDRLVAEAAAARRLLDRLDQAILAKAFRGELVPQDPADEPASVLLDRIRTERAESPEARRRTRRQQTVGA